MAESTFYFCEFEVEGTLTSVERFDPSKTREQRVRESVHRYLHTDGPVTETQEGRWYFGKVEEDNGRVYGKFGKVYSDKSTTYDEEVGDFIDEPGSKGDAEYAMFLLDFDERLLIYNSKDRVGFQAFRRNFRDGYNQRMGKDVTIEIDFLQNEEDVEFVIGSRPVQRAEFELEPSNPHSNPDWDALDDHIKEMLAEKLGVKVSSLENESLNFDDEILAQLMSMARSPYGEYNLVYNEDGQIKSITSKDEPIRVEDEEPDTLTGLKDMASGFISIASSYRK